MSNAFSCQCVLRRLRKLCEDKDLAPGVCETDREEILNGCVKYVRKCLKKREYLTICKLDAGGSEADIDVAILRALMKGMQIVCRLTY